MSVCVSVHIKVCKCRGMELSYTFSLGLAYYAI
uniref:Uncharacterized protein n=1 Tax=Arundo donax TaxID=35708 RepID=A0A0A9GZN7_ARUDO